LFTGVVQSLGTTWGLLRHYWVLIKLVLTVVSTVVLLIHTRPVGLMAHESAAMNLGGGDLVQARVQLIVAGAAAVVVLLLATVLSIYKPRGVTRYGLRRLAHPQYPARLPTSTGAQPP